MCSAVTSSSVTWLSHSRLQVPFVRTHDNLADFFTKPCKSASQFHAWRKRIMNNPNLSSSACFAALQPPRPAGAFECTAVVRASTVASISIIHTTTTRSAFADDYDTDSSGASTRRPSRRARWAYSRTGPSRCATPRRLSRLRRLGPILVFTADHYAKKADHWPPSSPSCRRGSIPALCAGISGTATTSSPIDAHLTVVDAGIAGDVSKVRAAGPLRAKIQKGTPRCRKGRRTSATGRR